MFTRQQLRNKLYDRVSFCPRPITMDPATSSRRLRIRCRTRHRIGSIGPRQIPAHENGIPQSSLSRTRKSAYLGSGDGDIARWVSLDNLKPTLTRLDVLSAYTTISSSRIAPPLPVSCGVGSDWRPSRSFSLFTLLSHKTAFLQFRGTLPRNPCSLVTHNRLSSANMPFERESETASQADHPSQCAPFCQSTASPRSQNRATSC